MHIAETGLEEPMWVFMGFGRRVDYERRFVTHPIGAREITGVGITSPAALRSSREGPEHLLEVELNHNRRKKVVDCRPRLPLVLRL